MYFLRYFAVFIGTAILSGPAMAADKVVVDIEHLKKQYQHPETIPFPKDRPYSLQVATLGKMLFFDPRLSGAQNMSCATCHNPSFGYEVPVATAVGAANTPLGRHAPTALNLAWTEKLFWDGRADSLEEQAKGPITASVEMNSKIEDVLVRLSNITEYKSWFERLFPGDGVSEKSMLQAIATFERTLVSNKAPFDRWVDGDETAISAVAKQGFVLFNGKAKCADCHTGWNFTDNKFHDIGLTTNDIGRAALEPDNKQAKYAFKTPGLRNLTYRAPFMHNGSVENLSAVVAHYIEGGKNRPSKSEKMHSLDLSDKEAIQLVAFLEALTAEKTNTPIPVLPN